MIAVAGGALIFIMFMIALIVGGDAGSQLAVSAKGKYLPYFIKAAAIAVVSGLLVFYVGGSHTLSLSTEKKENEVQG